MNKICAFVQNKEFRVMKWKEIANTLLIFKVAVVSTCAVCSTRSSVATAADQVRFLVYRYHKPKFMGRKLS